MRIITEEHRAKLRLNMAKARAARAILTAKPPLETPPAPILPETLDTDVPYRIALDLLGQGKTTKQACDVAKVSPSSLWRWQQCSDTNATEYARARALQARSWAEGGLEIADSATPKTANVAKLQVGTRQWLASRQAPREYGDRLEVESRGWLASVDVTRLSDDQIARIRAGENVMQVLGSDPPRRTLVDGSGDT